MRLALAPAVQLLALALLGVWSAPALASIDEAMAKLRQGNALEAEDSIQEVAAAGAEALPRLLEALQDQSLWVRARAEDTFPQRYLRIEILRALGELGGEQARGTLERAMSSEDEYTATHAVIAGCRLAGKTSDRLLALLQHPNGDLRNLAVNGMATIAALGRQDLAALAQALRDPEWYVRDSAAAALGQVGDKTVLKALQELLNDPSPFVARTAREAVQRIKKR